MTVHGLRPVVHDDIGRLTVLNNAAIPAVTPADEAHMARLVATSTLAWAVEANGEITAFVLLFGPGAAYDSPTYRWFSDRYDDFLYVEDRKIAMTALDTSPYEVVGVRNTPCGQRRRAIAVGSAECTPNFRAS